MSIAKEEMQLRHDLNAAMKGLWLLTWHEDGQVNPGVPDTSYVMKGGDYETGWIELKAAVLSPKGTFTLRIEASQHDWMEGHHSRIPCHFLVRVHGRIYLVSGAYHRSLAERNLTPEKLANLSDVVFEDKDTRQVLHDALKKYTFRGRNGRTG